MFLLVIFNNKTGDPKGAVQQMEVETATLYNTMHVNLQETDRPEFGAEAMDLNMATGSLCTVVRHFQDIHLFRFLLPYVLPLSFLSPSEPESSSLPNPAGLGKTTIFRHKNVLNYFYTCSKVGK